MNESKELSIESEPSPEEEINSKQSNIMNNEHSQQQSHNNKKTQNGEREVDFNLINSIIGEMKCEFNKNILDDDNKDENKLKEANAIENNKFGKEKVELKDNNETKPRIVITLKNTEENDGVKKLKSKEQEESWTLVKVEPNPIESKNLTSNTGKRSLRSQKAILEEPSGVKRSARRRSKDCPRESVLQSAIARKEKSFSHMAPSSRTSGRLSKNRRSSPNSSKSESKSKTSKPTTTVSQTITTALSKNKLEDPTPSLNNESFNSTSTILPESNSNINNKLPTNFTKTGKRRYKPFKGLRYSFNSNKNKQTRKTQRYRSTSESTNASLDKEINSKQDLSLNNKKADDIKITSNHLNTVTALKEISSCSTSRSESPLTAETCPLGNFKRKQSNSDLIYNEDNVKKTRNDLSSSLGQSNGNTSTSLCHCQKSAQLYVACPPNDLFCQGTDTLSDRLVGCCNLISDSEVELLRASTRVPYLLLCRTHRERFHRHGCCPTCGIFCTEGKFVLCPSKHLYHRDCQMTVKGIGSICPHCGVDSPKEDTRIRITYDKMPIFLPQQKPPKPHSPAKMSCHGIENMENDTNENFNVPKKELILPNGNTITTDGLVEEINGANISALVAANKSSLNSSIGRYTIKSLYMAAKAGNTEKVISILATGLDPNQLYASSGNYPLHAACIAGHLTTVHALHIAGAQLDVLDREQNSPLLSALTISSNDSVIKYLIKSGADINYKTEDGMTALHIAAKAGNLAGCHYLLMKHKQKNYINQLDEGNWTPLVWAAEHGHSVVVRYLLEKHADPLIRDLENNQAMHWAALCGSMEICESLIEYGCEVNCVNIHGDTPLHIAARQNNYDCVMFLLIRGGDIRLKNKQGDLPIACCTPGSDCEAAFVLNTQISINRHSGGQIIISTDITKGKESNPIQCINAVGDGEQAPKDFVYVTENCFTSHLNGPNRLITSLKSCKCTESCNSNNCECANLSMKCWYDTNGKLGESFNFSDPPMLFECNPACNCSIVRCQNRVVQHGISCRFQLFRTETRGWGVRTLMPIPKGTYVCEYIGEIISDSEAERREDDTYLFDLIIKDEEDDGTFCIDARYYGNIARFINHMCVPNLLPVHTFIDHQDVHFPRIAFFTNRHVKANEELGFDYGVKFWKIKGEDFTCTCGHEKCRYSEMTIKETLENYKRKQEQLSNLKINNDEELTIPNPLL